MHHLLTFPFRLHDRLLASVRRCSEKEGYVLWSAFAFFSVGAAFFHLCRSGMYPFPLAEFHVFLLAITIIGVPIFGRALFSASSPAEPKTPPPLELLLISSFYFLPFVIPHRHVLYALGSAVLLLLSYHASIFFRKERLFIFLPLIGGLSFFVAALQQGNFFLNFTVLEAALLGIGYTDPMIDSAFAGVVSNHGHLSMGFDGFVPRTYHFFSHIWMGRGFQLFDLPPVFSYALFVNILLFPLMILALFCVILTYTEDRIKMNFSVPTALLTIGYSIVFLFHYDWRSFLGVPTYVAALPTFILGIGFLRNRHSSFWVNFAFSLSLMTLLIASKVSVGYAWMILAVLVSFFCWGLPARKIILFILSHLTWALVILKFVQPQEDTSGMPFEFLHFIKEFGYDFYLTKHFATAIFFGLLYGIKYRWLRQTCFLPLRFVACAYGLLLACMLPGLSINIVGGSAWYFSNIPAWLFIALIAIELNGLVLHLYHRSRRQCFSLAGILTIAIFFQMLTVARTQLFNVISTKADIINHAAPGTYDKFTIAHTGGNFFTLGYAFLKTSKVTKLYEDDLFNLIRLRPFFQKHRDAPAFISWNSRAFWNDPAWGYFKMVRLQAFTGQIQLLGVPEDPADEMRYFQSAHQMCGSTSSRLYEKLGQGAHFASLCRDTQGSYIQGVIRTQRKLAEGNIKELCRLAVARGFQRFTELSVDLSSGSVIDCSNQQVLAKYDVNRGYF